MGVRSWLVDLLGRGEVEPRDPDELVEVVEVALANGPLLVSVLEDHGIDAKGVQSIDIRTDTRNRYRIMVRRADAERAAAIVDEVLTA